MSFIIEGEPDGTDSNYVNVDIDSNPVLLLTVPETDESYILQTTPINLVVPVTLTTEVPKKTKPKKPKLPPLHTCKICKYTTSRLQYFERHQETHWVVKKNVKENVQTTSVNDVPETKTVIKESTEYKCPHCNYYTGNIRSLRIHMHIHQNEDAYRCRDCKFKGKNLEELISHHKNSKTLTCKYCTFTTHNKELYRAHKEHNHAAKWFGCVRCNFAAADRGYLIKHMTEQHSKALRFDPVQLDPEPEKEGQIPETEGQITETEYQILEMESQIPDTAGQMSTTESVHQLTF